MLSVSLTALFLAFSPLQTAPQQDQEAPAPLPPVTVAAQPQQDAEPETRRVCRFETQIGSNRRTRVCRDVPRQGVQDQATRDFMRDSQRIRMPDG